MNIIFCVDSEGNEVAFSSLFLRSNTLGYVFELLRDCVVVCAKQEERLTKLIPCAKVVVLDQKIKPNLPDFLTPINDFADREVVGDFSQLQQLLSRLNCSRVFAIGQMAKIILTQKDFSHINADKAYIATLSTPNNLCKIENILPENWRKMNVSEPLVDNDILDYVTTYEKRK